MARQCSVMNKISTIMPRVPPWLASEGTEKTECRRLLQANQEGPEFALKTHAGAGARPPHPSRNRVERSFAVGRRGNPRILRRRRMRGCEGSSPHTELGRREGGRSSPNRGSLRRRLARSGRGNGAGPGAAAPGRPGKPTGRGRAVGAGTRRLATCRGVSAPAKSIVPSSVGLRYKLLQSTPFCDCSALLQGSALSALAIYAGRPLNKLPAAQITVASRQQNRQAPHRGGSRSYTRRSRRRGWRRPPGS